MNSTRNKTDLLTKCFLFTSNFIDVDTFTCFWIDLVHVLAMTGNMSAVAGYTPV